MIDGITLRLSSDPEFPRNFFFRRVPSSLPIVDFQLVYHFLNFPNIQNSFPLMSEKESIRAALQILSLQLTQLTFGDIDGVKTIDIEPFLSNFEAILTSITSLTHSSFPSSVKKTMLQAQLRGGPLVWRWGLLN